MYFVRSEVPILWTTRVETGDHGGSRTHSCQPSEAGALPLGVVTWCPREDFHPYQLLNW